MIVFFPQLPSVYQPEKKKNTEKYTGKIIQAVSGFIDKIKNTKDHTQNTDNYHAQE